jgi:hypothetical protein
MDQDIIEYVRSCLEYQKDKVTYHKPYGLLSPLELPYVPWTSIAMDFITDTITNDDTQEGYINHIISVQGLVTRNVKATQERMKKYADLKHKDALEFKIGDLIMLDGRHIQTR